MNLLSSSREAFRLGRTSLFVGTLLLLAGCVQPAPNPARPAGPVPEPDHIGGIKFNGVAYASADAALAALRDIQAKQILGLAKDVRPLPGRALVIIPDRDRLRPLIAQKLQQMLKRPVGGEALAFNIEVEHQEVRAMADALAQARPFETVTVVEQNDTRDPDIGDAGYLVWFQVRTLAPDNTGPWYSRWQVRRAGSTATAGAAMDMGTAAGTPRYASFVRAVHEAAIRLAGGAGGVNGFGEDTARGAVSSGSGFAVDAAGDIVTNEHVVSACSRIETIDAAHTSHEATVLAHDAADDLAILKTALHLTAFATFRDGDELRPGDSIVAIGYPLGDLLSSSASVTTGSLTATTGPRNDSRLLQVSAPIQLGNSGGPLLDRDGNVVGVVSGTLNSMTLGLLTGVVPQNVNFAVKEANVRSLLEANKISYNHSAGRHELSAADVGEQTARFTVRVLCYR
jgi:S1-C subfamily serine protease